MYHLRLTPDEAMFLRGALVNRLAELGAALEVEPDCESDIPVLTHLISRSHPWRSQATAAVEIELSPDELTVVDRTVCHTPRLRRYLAPHPAVSTAIQSLRRKVGRAAKPAPGPLAVLLRLLTGEKATTM